MTIDHVALWTDDLERLKDFYIKYFGATANEKYYNIKTNFESYFLTFGSLTKLEIMTRPGVPENKNDTIKAQHKGIIHLAFGVDKQDDVDEKARQLLADGFRILRGPRISGDGYYEFETVDPDNNRLEVITKLPV